MTDPSADTAFRAALSRILRPLVRMMIARGLRFPELADRLKALYVGVAEGNFGLAGRRLTDSRVSLLTGLQRKDVRALRKGPGAEAPEPPGAGPLPRVLARWSAGPPYAEAPGRPRPLPRAPLPSTPQPRTPQPRTGAGPSFETLAGEVSRDLHPRTLLDELVRLGLVRHDAEADTVTLAADAFLPGRDEAALLGYLGANLADHAEAAAANLAAAPEPGPFFERAVHYNRLTPAAVAELDALARRLQGAALAELNARALELQARDEGNPEAQGRFRAGAYVYRCPPGAPTEDSA